MLKVSENPPILFPEHNAIEEIESTWWVAHTKSRNEKALAWDLLKWNIPYFLPLVEKASKRNGRTYRTLLPLFGGYVFFSGDEHSRYKAFTTNRIAGVIPVIDQAGLIHDLSQIFLTLQSGVPLDPHPYLKHGDRCRVIAGPLCGVEGIFLNRKKQTKLILQINILGQAAAVEMDAAMLEPFV